MEGSPLTLVRVRVALVVEQPEMRMTKMMIAIRRIGLFLNQEILRLRMPSTDLLFLSSLLANHLDQLQPRLDAWLT